MDQMTDQNSADIKMENGHTEDYQKLVEYGIDATVAAELERIYATGKLSHPELDDRALEAIKEFGADDAKAVLKQFCDSNLEHVTNKSAFLCGQMKTYRQKLKASGGTTITAKGPDEAKIKEILDRTGYSLDVTTGQRKYGGPPPESDGSQPGPGHEIFCGKIPKDVFEDELIPLFEKVGRLWDLRLMMDPMTGFNRGYAFITYCTKEGAQEATKELDNHEIKPGKRLKVNVSIANLRLFVGNIPKNKSKEEIKEEFGKKTELLQDVIVYGSADNPKMKNRGFAFLEYDSHKSASTARRKLGGGRFKVWGCDIIVDWADPVEEPDSGTMSKVKVLYVRNLTSEVTEQELKDKFEPYGKIEKVKKIKDYGFVHFEERDDAVKAMEELNGAKLGGMDMDVSLAKPPTDNRKKEMRKREQERRQFGMMGWDDWWGPLPPMPPGRMGGPMRGGMRRPPQTRGYPDAYYDDYYGYEYDDYYGGYGAQQGRGRGRGGPPGPPMGAKGPRGARGGAMRSRGASMGNARGAMRGGVKRGGMVGAAMNMRGGRGMAANRTRAGKRKAVPDASAVQAKRRNVQGGWGSQPIAQQPLSQSGYGGGYGAGYGGEDQWYQDSYGQNW